MNAEYTNLSTLDWRKCYRLNNSAVNRGINRFIIILIIANILDMKRELGHVSFVNFRILLNRINVKFCEFNTHPSIRFLILRQKKSASKKLKNFCSLLYIFFMIKGYNHSVSQHTHILYNKWCIIRKQLNLFTTNIVWTCHPRHCTCGTDDVLIWQNVTATYGYRMFIKK